MPPGCRSDTAWTGGPSRAGPPGDAAGLHVHQVTLPVPFPVRTANVYLIGAPEGTVLVDTGFYTPEAWERLARAVAEFTDAAGPLRAIVLTHHHPDHVGMAGRLQRHHGVPVLASAGEARLTAEVWDPRFPASDTEFYREHGMPAPVLESIMDEHRYLFATLPPLPEVERIPVDRPLTLAGLRFAPVITPGHSPAHLCLFHEASGILVVGDHLLPRITPNIGWYPYTPPDPLRDFLHSLRVIEQLPVRQAFPGHGPAMRNVRARIAELRTHHAARLAVTRALLDGNTLTGYQAALGIFGAGLPPQEARLAMVEAIAHLEHLRHQGEVVRDRCGPQAVYRRR